MKTVLTTLLFCITLVAMSQNRLMVMKPGDSIGSIRLVKESEDYYVHRYDIPKAPSLVSASFPYSCPFRKVANDMIHDFQFQHLDNDYINEQYSLNLDGHLQLVQYISDEDVNSFGWDSTVERIKHKLVSNALLQEAIYSWLMPVYQDAFAAMSIPEQDAYLRIFNNGIAYLDSFNLAREKAVADEAASFEGKGGDGQYNFILTRGELNAFLYRRISKNEMSKEDCMKWLKRIVKDFESARRKNPTEADNYIITELLQFDYAIGGMFVNKYGTFTETAVLRLSGSAYEVLPEKISGIVYRKGNLLIGRSTDTSYSSSLFMFDSTGYTFANSHFNDHCYQHKVLGDEQNKRLLLLCGYDWFPEGEERQYMMASCFMIDADSGTMVRDTFYMMKDNDDGWYSDNYILPGLGAQHIIYRDPKTLQFGMMDEYGNEILSARYTSIEPTDDPRKFLVNGRKKVKVRS